MPFLISFSVLAIWRARVLGTFNILFFLLFSVYVVRVCTLARVRCGDQGSVSCVCGPCALWRPGVCGVVFSVDFFLTLCLLGEHRGSGQLDWWPKKSPQSPLISLLQIPAVSQDRLAIWLLWVVKTQTWVLMLCSRPNEPFPPALWRSLILKYSWKQCELLRYSKDWKFVEVNSCILCTKLRPVYALFSPWLLVGLVQKWPLQWSLMVSHSREMLVECLGILSNDFKLYCL